MCGALMYLSRSPLGLLSVLLSARTDIAIAGICLCSTLQVVAIGYLARSPAPAKAPWPFTVKLLHS